MTLMVIISNFEIEGVLLPVYSISKIDSNGDLIITVFEIWEVAGYAVLFVVSFYFILSTYRIFYRKINKVENKGQTGSCLEKLYRCAS